jgi:hypothetical protein
MWREYFGFAATALAVVNGLIAMLIAMLPVRRSVHKLRLGATALALAALAVGATFYSTYHTHARIERQQSDRAESHKRLTAFVQEGRDLLAQIKDAQVELPAKAADDWAQRVEIYLRGQLGERYVSRFRSDTSDRYGDDPAVAAGRLAYWRAVRNRLVNVEAIDAEFTDRP